MQALIKNSFVALSLAAGCGVASAATVTLSGDGGNISLSYVLTPQGTLGLSGGSFTQVVSGPQLSTRTLEGWGVLTNLGGTNLLTTPYEITAHFTGFTQTDALSPFSGGSVSLYIDGSPDFNAPTALDATALAASKALAVNGTKVVEFDARLIGGTTLLVSGDPINGPLSASGRFDVDLSNSLADWAYFLNTNALTSFMLDLTSTLIFEEGFVPVGESSEVYSNGGLTGRLGAPNVVPEPASLALLGLGLLGAGAVRRRQKSA